MVAVKVTPRLCTVGNAEDFERNEVTKKDRVHGNGVDLLPFASVCSLAALITTVCKSHRSICGLIISQKPPRSGHVCLLLHFLGQEGRIKGKDHQFVPFFWLCLVIPGCRPQCKLNFFILFNNLTTAMLHKLHPLRAIFTIFLTSHWRHCRR